MKIEFNSGNKKVGQMPLSEMKLIFKEIINDIKYGVRYGNIKDENGALLGRWHL